MKDIYFILSLKVALFWADLPILVKVLVGIVIFFVLVFFPAPEQDMKNYFIIGDEIFFKGQDY